MTPRHILRLVVIVAIMGALAWIAGQKLVSARRQTAITNTPKTSHDPRAMARIGGNDTAVRGSVAAMASSSPSREAIVASVAAQLREWMDDDDPELRERRIADIDRMISDGGRRPIREQLDLVAALPDAMMDFAFGLPSLQQWMFAEPRAALEWIEAHPGISQARVLTLFQEWRDHDRAAARAYIEQLPPGEWKDKAVVAATHAGLADDPTTAINWARDMKRDAAQLGLLGTATTEWARRDAVTAGRWVGGIDDLSLREELTSSLAVGFADTDPQAAAALVLDSMLPGPVLDRSIGEIAGAWARREPAAAAVWIAKFPAGHARQLALENLVSAWRATDRGAAVEWARGLADESLRREAIELLDERSPK